METIGFSELLLASELIIIIDISDLHIMVRTSYSNTLKIIQKSNRIKWIFQDQIYRETK